MSPPSNLLFEHFDPDVELGTLDEQGRSIRPRKKPGRKPNPPTPAQRKAQNRAAQRAFRERKRQAMREAEATIKRYALMRDQAYREIRRLKKRLEELEFESNYLKGYTLALKMACIANRVELPQFWEMKKRKVNSNCGRHKKRQEQEKKQQQQQQQQQRCYNGSGNDIPRIFEFFLDEDAHIISIDQNLEQQKLHEQHTYPERSWNSCVDVDETLSSPSVSSSCSPPTSSVSSSCPYYSSEDDDMVQEDMSMSSSIQQYMLTEPLLSLQDTDSSTSMAGASTSSTLSAQQQDTLPNVSNSPKQDVSDNDFDQLFKSISSIAPHLAAHLESPFLQEITKTDLISQLLSYTTSPAPQQELLLPVADMDISMSITQNSLLSLFSNGNNDHSMSSGPSNQLLQQSFADMIDALPFDFPATIPAITNMDTTVTGLTSTSISDDASSFISSAAGDREETVIDQRTGVERTITTDLYEEDDETIDAAGNNVIDSNNIAPIEMMDTVQADSFETNNDTSSCTHTEPLNNTKKKIVLPPMTALEALVQIHSMKQLAASTRALFTPTELQKRIRHDTRIDVVPGASIRDHMILFQDFYNANELFDFLAAHACFLGGEDLGNMDAWFVPPTFFKKYWFLCPNQKVDRLDNAVEIMVHLGKKVVQWMEATEPSRTAEAVINEPPASGRTCTGGEEKKEMEPIVTTMQQSNLPTNANASSLLQSEEPFLQPEDNKLLDDFFSQQQQQTAEEFLIEQFLMDEDLMPSNDTTEATETALDAESSSFPPSAIAVEM